MDSFEWNKIAGAVLGTLLIALGLSIFSEILFETETPESPGYVIAVAEEATEEGGGEPAAQPIGILMASADAAAGEASAKKCAACHTFAQGEAHKIGPNLWDIVNRPIASAEGYEYSPDMQAFAEEAQSWTFEHLNTYLTNPKGVVPGTKMAFAGLKKDPERANVIAYLRSLSASPAPLPEPEAEAAEAAPAEGGEAAAEEATAAADAPAEAAAPEAGQPAAPAEGQPAQESAAAPAEGQAGQEQAAAPAEPPPAADAAEAPAAEEQTAQAEQPAEAAPAEAAPGEPAAASGGAESGGAESGFAAQVAAADPAAGEAFAKRCVACHSLEEGGANKVGPHIWGVVGRPVASVEDYAYSDAMIAFSEGGAKAWDIDTLHTYLANPREVVPGTKMVFPGIRKEADLANVVAYLQTLSATPPR